MMIDAYSSDMPPLVAVGRLGRQPTKEDIGKRFLMRTGDGKITQSCIGGFSPSGKLVNIECDHARCVPHGWCFPLHVELLEEMPLPEELKPK